MSLPYSADQRRAARAIQDRISNARITQRDAKHRRQLARLEFMCAKATADAATAEAEAASYMARVEVINRRGRHDGP